jgi:hypothetical protein
MLPAESDLLHVILQVTLYYLLLARKPSALCKEAVFLTALPLAQTCKAIAYLQLFRESVSRSL